TLLRSLSASPSSHAGMPTSSLTAIRSARIGKSRSSRQPNSREFRARADRFWPISDWQLFCTDREKRMHVLECRVRTAQEILDLTRVRDAAGLILGYVKGCRAGTTSAF